MIAKYKNFTPKIDNSAFIAETAAVIGNVEIEKDVSIWFSTVIRGDMNKISIGENSNIQDGSVIHCILDEETKIGKNVIIGHNCILHSCTIDDGSLIGMGAIVLDRAKIGKNCLIGAGSVVTPGTIIPDNSLALGSPAKIKRELTKDEINNFQKGINEYKILADCYKK
jgi:carbonic anhydrase/acetyltransferase-like protein (isoleucine patch superfamily)